MIKLCSKISKSVYRVKLSCLSNLFRSTRGGFPYTRFDRIFARPFPPPLTHFLLLFFFFEPFVALDRARYLAMQHTRNLCNTGFCSVVILRLLILAPCFLFSQCNTQIARNLCNTILLLCYLALAHTRALLSFLAMQHTNSSQSL